MLEECKWNRNGMNTTVAIETLLEDLGHATETF